jgi:hypothetical protein
MQPSQENIYLYKETKTGKLLFTKRDLSHLACVEGCIELGMNLEIRWSLTLSFYFRLVR